MYDKTIELLPLNLQFDLAEIKLEHYKLPEITLGHNKLVTHKFFENMDATVRQEFKNPCKENSLKLQPIPVELWLEIFSYLNGNALVCVLLSCKFYAEITNDQSIRNRMGERMKLIKLDCLINKPNQFFSEIKPKYGLYSEYTPLVRSCLEIFPKEENKELYQTGDKGFVMK
ncbi:F-box protein [Legionella pneumophila]|uniref:F-box protein n=1 Tax=Legionella pneumophila TaxID=446 RepID=UPI003A4C6628